MSAGEYGAGEGDAGEDPVADATAARDESPGRALYLDGASKAFAFSASEPTRLERLHPVEHRVGMALMVRLGRIASAPTVGNTLHEIPATLTGAALTAEADRRVRLALSAPLAAGDVELRGVTAERARSGRLRVKVRFYNVRAARERTINVEPRAS